MKWFKHDSTANMDAKLQEVLLDYGLEGYGLYWYCLELIAGKVEPGNLTFELEHDCRIIARNTGSTAQRVQEMMTRFVDLGLFENSQGTITCLKMAKVSDDYTAKLIRSEQTAKKPQAIENKEVLQTPTNSEKVSLEENRTEEKREDETTTENLMSPNGSACSCCNGDGWITLPNGAQGGCWVCGGTGNQPVVNSESTPVQPEMTFPVFRVCDKCGNKRCPHAHDKRDNCTGSNELGQIGSFTGYCAHPDRFAEQQPKADKPLNVPFDDFWDLYNKKVGRKKAETRWKRLTNKDRAAIMEHLPNYIRNTPDVQYRKNPETYLNAESWNDELPNMSKPVRPDYPENQGVDKSIHTKQMTGLASELTSEQRKAASERIKAMLRDSE